MIDKLNFILNEKAYIGNLGFEEMVKFGEKANKSQIKQLEKAIENEDGNSFKKLIFEVLGIQLV